MTVATLLLTCLIFLLLRWTGPNYYITALSIGGIVCIASSKRWHHFTGLKPWFPGRLDAKVSADCDSDRRVCVGAGEFWGQFFCC